MKLIPVASQGQPGHRQRLRERFLQSGLDGFLDYEIVELLLTFATPRKDCRAAARQTLERFGSLKAVLEADPADLRRVKGIGPQNVFGLKITQAVARRYLADRIRQTDFIENSAQVLDFLRHILRDRTQETFLTIYLNGRNQILGSEELFRGSLTASAVYPREVVKKALAWHAAALVFVHNHPSGNLNPSQEDIRITRRLKAAVETIDITVHDHIIIAGDAFYSMADQGVL